MTEERKPLSVEIPDLLIEAESSLSSRRILSKRPSTAASGVSVGASTPKLQASPPTGHSRGYDLEDSLDDGHVDFELLVAPRAHAPENAPHARWPVAATPDPASIPVSADLLARVIPYGEPPRHLFEAPIYAWLVYRQQSELKRRILQAQQGLAQVEAERDRVLGQWIDAIRPQLANDERMSRVLERLTADEAELQSIASDASRFSAETERDRQALQQSAADLRVRLQASLETCQADSARLGDAERALARAEAARKRAEIEARAGDSLPAASRRSLPIPDADTALRVAAEQLEQARQRSVQTDLARNALAVELRQLEDRLARAERVGIEKTSRVEQKHKATELALLGGKAEIGRMVLALRDSRYIDDSTVEQLLRLDGQVTDAANELRHLVLALDAFDRAAVKRGLWFMLVAVALGCLGVLLSIFR